MAFWFPLFGGIALGIWGYKKVQEKKEALKELFTDPKGCLERWFEEQNQKDVQRGLKLLELEEKKEGDNDA